MTPAELTLRAIDHVAVVVDDLEDAARLLTSLGLRASGASEPPGLRTAFFELDRTRIELIEFFDGDARGERLGDAPARIDHIAFAVTDLGNAVEALAALGIETTAVQKAGERRTCWSKPATTDGVLYQFLEVADSG